ncbi:transposable element Tcb1 transposase [Trichonephila clavipes]|nr:transposable element Tcb1 transposase [Trichonephila clavipes]
MTVVLLAPCNDEFRGPRSDYVRQNYNTHLEEEYANYRKTPEGADTQVAPEFCPPVRRVPLTTTHCHLRLTWSREHALWTPQQWSCVIFSDESRFSLPSDSHRTLIWGAPGTRYHQENTVERHRYGGAG